MLGKYDFDSKHLPRILEYFEVTSAFAFTIIELIDEFIEKNNLKFDQFKKIKKIFLEIEFLDQFQEVRDEFYFAYEDSFYYFMKLENEKKKIDFDDIKVKLFTAKEAFLITDNLIRYCYDFIKKANVVPSTQHIVELMLNKAKFYLSQFLTSSISESNIFTIEHQKNFKSLTNEGDINIWNKVISSEIDSFEKKWSKHKEEVSYIEEINISYWKIYGLLIQIRTLIDMTFLL